MKSNVPKSDFSNTHFAYSTETAKQATNNKKQTKAKLPQRIVKKKIGNISTSKSLPIEELAYDSYFNALRKKEYSYLDNKNNKQIYLDYTGSNPVPKILVDLHCDFLKSNVLGNPHSKNPTSNLSTEKIDQVRDKVLNFYKAKDSYYCIFTNNASSAIQIIANSYSFTPTSCFLLPYDNHNSILGIRECCKNTKYIRMNSDLTINNDDLDLYLNGFPESENKLLAFPAQSNSTGVKHPLEIIKMAKDLGWDVLLDAAAYLPTSILDLSKYNPDFVTGSFYKIFGYPAGIGFLLVLKERFDKLNKYSFSGGNVDNVGFNPPTHQWSNGHAKFENGTINFTGIPAIMNGLKFIDEIGLEKISKRVTSLSNYLIKKLQNCKHTNMNPLINIFGPGISEDRSGTINLNFLDKSGKVYPFKIIEALATKLKISLRTGRFCNYGIFEVINSCKRSSNHAESLGSCKACDYLEVASGAVRVSLGIATTKKDIDRFVEFVNSFKNKMVVQSIAS